MRESLKARQLVNALLENYEEPAHLENWQPERSHVDWMRSMLRILKNGAVWHAPVNNTLWKIDHQHRTLTLIDGPVDDMFWMTQKVLEPLGYTARLSSKYEDDDTEIDFAE